MSSDAEKWCGNKTIMSNKKEKSGTTLGRGVCQKEVEAES
jgi:hypothetical protein